MLTLTVGTAVTVSAEDTAIDVIDIAGYTEPKVGDDVQASLDALITPVSCGYEIAYSEWYNIFDQTSATDKFEDGKRYELVILVVPKDGYCFAEDAEFNVIDAEADIYAVDKDMANAYISVSFAEPIDKVEITGVKDAVVGETASTDGIKIPEGANYEITNASWTDLTGDDQTGDFTGVFADKNKYTLDIELTAKEGYEFVTTEFTVNGKETKLSYNFNNAEVGLSLEYSFLDPISKIEIPAFPSEVPTTMNAVSSEPVVQTEYYEVYGDWQEYDGSYFESVDVDTPSESGKLYRYEYYVYTADGYEITDDTVITIGGKTPTGGYDYVDDTYASFFKTYNLNSNYQAIKSIEFTITEPAIDADIDNKACTVSERTGFSVLQSMWFVSSNGKLTSSDMAKGKFEEGKYYGFMAVMGTKEGYYFSEDIVIKVNGTVYDHSKYAESYLGEVSFITDSMVILIHEFDKLTKPVTDNNNNNNNNNNGTGETIPDLGVTSSVVVPLAIMLTAVVGLSSTAVLLKKKED